jgi:hypothetical protein
MRPMLGGALFYETADVCRDVVGHFAEGRCHRLLTVVNEVRARDTFEVSDRLKDAITSGTLNYERKGVQSVTMGSFERYVFTTNNAVAVKVEDDDRRFFVLECSSEHVGDRAYFNGLAAWLGDPTNRRAFLEHLRGLDISQVNWISDRPLTGAYQRMRAATIPPELSFLADSYLLLPQGTQPFDVSGKAMYESFVAWCKPLGLEKCAGSVQSFGRSMSRITPEQGITKKVSNGVKYTIYPDKMAAFLRGKGFGTTVDFMGAPGYGEESI